MGKAAELAKKGNEVLKLPEGAATLIGETGITAIRVGKLLIVFGEVTTNPELVSAGNLYFGVRFASKPHISVEPLRSAGGSSWVRAESRGDFQGLTFDRSAATPFKWMAIGEESETPFAAP